MNLKEPLSILHNAIKMRPYTSLAMRNTAIAAHLTQVQSVTVEAFFPTIDAFVMRQQSYMTTSAEYKRMLDYIAKIPALIKMQNTVLQLERFFCQSSKAALLLQYLIYLNIYLS